MYIYIHCSLYIYIYTYVRYMNPHPFQGPFPLYGRRSLRRPQRGALRTGGVVAGRAPRLSTVLFCRFSPDMDIDVDVDVDIDIDIDTDNDI